MFVRASTVDTLRGSSLSPFGTSSPLGATICAGGVNFSVFSKHATGVQLLFFDRVDDAIPARIVDLDARAQRSYHYWHAFVLAIQPGQIYGYRVAGPFDPASGRRFNVDKVLLDPYGKCIARPSGWSRAPACRPGDNCATALKSVIADPGAYDWEGDRSPRISFARTVIYEMHVGAFTRNPNSGVIATGRGGYAGLVEKIPYLRTSASPLSNCSRSSPSMSRMPRMV